MAMCQYLYAAFSLRTTPGPGLTAEQLEVVERWRADILRIAAEEMLHWALVNNLLTAIGSAPFVSRPNLPHRAKGYPPTVQFALLPVSETALRHFVYFERPQDVDVEEVPEFAPIGRRPAAMTETELQPRTQDYVSQGELYRALDDGLEFLARRFGETGLFIGPPSAQATAASFGWPDLIAVTDLATARIALSRIIEQGEGGTSQDMDTAHYGRFLKILDEYLAMREADPTFEPAHPVSAAIVRTVEDEEPSGPTITAPATAAVADLFNVVNDLVLQILARYFSFGHETTEQLGVLTEVGVDLMFGAIKPLGLLLARLPVGEAHPGLTAGANFQLAYRSNFLLSHRRVAWVRFSERLEEAANFSDAIATDDETKAELSIVSAALRQGAKKLQSQIGSMPSDDRVAQSNEAGAVEPRVEVTPGGPYRVLGGVPIRRVREVRSEAGEPMAWQTTERFATRNVALLCRCGGSANKPFCDNTHRRLEWESVEAAPETTYDERMETYAGAGLTVADDRSICVRAGFCSTKVSNVWKMVQELAPDDTAARAHAIGMIERCPSGALTYRVDPADEAIEPELAMAIGVIDDGPLLVTGRVPIERSDGVPLESRNRLTLCRCGASKIKPLCDGSHKAIGFRDAGGDQAG